MLDFMKALSTSASAMRAQSDRLRIVSENMANADTPGYRRKMVSFGNYVDDATGARNVRVNRMMLDQSDPVERFEPTNPLANDEGIMTYSNVNLLTEIADAREAQRSFEANLNLFDQTRRMYTGLLELLRNR